MIERSVDVLTPHPTSQGAITDHHGGLERRRPCEVDERSRKRRGCDAVDQRDLLGRDQCRMKMQGLTLPPTRAPVTRHVHGAQSQSAAIQSVHDRCRSVAHDCAWSTAFGGYHDSAAVACSRIEFVEVIGAHVDPRCDSVQLAAPDRSLQLRVAGAVAVSLCPRENLHAASVMPPRPHTDKQDPSGDCLPVVEHRPRALCK